MNETTRQKETDASAEERAKLLWAGLLSVRRAMRATEAARRMGVEAIRKADASPVTIADFASQVVIARSLARELRLARPSLRLLGEENDDAFRGPDRDALLAHVVAAAQAGDPLLEAEDVLEVLAAPRADPREGPCWTLDPVDGTKGFLRGGQYAIALAWLDDGPSVAVMGCPRLSLEGPEPSATGGLLAGAVRGVGATMTSVDATSDRLGEPILLQVQPWQPGEPIRLALSVEAAHGNADEAFALAERFGPVVPVRLDSAAKYFLLAAGRVDAYLRIPRDPNRSECLWDHAAGALIATAAGCRVTDLDGRELDFTQGATLSRNRGIMATRGVIVSP